MTENNYFIPIYDNNNKIIAIKNKIFDSELKSLTEIINILNLQQNLIQQIENENSRFKHLLKENIKPTTKDGFKDVYLDIDTKTKRCKYEKTFVCYDCWYFSSYFLNCSLMMEDEQYKKALELGVVKKDD